MTSSHQQTFSSPEVRVVEASAGSGKTYALAKRYVQLVLNPALHKDLVPIRTILALTFTNKAAFEMKARILQFLKKIALKDIAPQDQANILDPLGLSLEQASQDAYQVMDFLIRNYNFFQVQTIDKFINALLSGCAFKIGLTSNFRIKTNSHEYLLYSLDQMIDDAAQQPEKRQILESFLHQYLYIENRSGWFPKDDILSIICALFSQYNTYGKPFLRSATTIEELIVTKKSLLSLMQNLQEILPEDVHATFRKSLDSFLSKHTQGFDIDTVSDSFAHDEIPLRKGAVASEEVYRLWKKIHAGLKTLCEEEACSLFNPYIEIFQMIRKNLMDFSSTDDVLFLEELNSRAASLFDDDYITVEELYYRLATRFQHYLIDEFQDTSQLQWHNLETMVEEALSTGGTLFYVGDKKQAIYRFRGGEARIFDQIKERFDMFNVKTDLLSKNWRSHKEIVEFNNAVFSIDNLKLFIRAKEAYESDKKKKNPVVFNDEDFVELQNVFQDSHQSHNSSYGLGYVRIEYIDAEKKQDRDEMVSEKLIDLIRDLRQRFEYRDIAILTRGNKEIEVMTNWLLEHGIPVESERTSNIKENTLVSEIICLLRFLSSPIDNISFAQFILGDIFSNATGIDKQEFSDFIFGLREKMHDEKDLYLYIEFRKAYPELWARLIDEFFKNVGLYPLYELVVSIYNRLNILEGFMNHQGFFMHLLELIRLQEEESSDVSSFLEYYENLSGEKMYVEIADSNAVKLLTIHKSKGLEFPVVILPFLGMDVQVGSSNANYQQSYILREHEEELSLLRLKSKYYSFSDRLYAVYREEYKKSFISELNNIYVALTRPKCELYAFIPKKVGNAFNFVQLLIPTEQYARGQMHRYEAKKEEEQALVPLAPSHCRDWIHYLSEEFEDDRNLERRMQRLRGELMHFLLSEITEIQDFDDGFWQDVEARAQAQFPLLEDVAGCCAQVQELIQSPHLKIFFAVQDVQVFNEREIVTANGESRRIDRLIVGNDEVKIVDYKSSETDFAKDQKQVRGYIELMQSLYPGKAVKGFVVYLDSKEVKEIS